jgi:hypothetical protein
MENYEFSKLPFEGQLNPKEIVGKIKQFLPENGISLQEFSLMIGLDSNYVLACIEHPNDWSFLVPDERTPYIKMKEFLDKLELEEDEEEDDKAKDEDEEDEEDDDEEEGDEEGEEGKYTVEAILKKKVLKNGQEKYLVNSLIIN